MRIKSIQDTGVWGPLDHPKQWSQALLLAENHEIFADLPFPSFSKIFNVLCKTLVELGPWHEDRRFCVPVAVSEELLRVIRRPCMFFASKGDARRVKMPRLLAGEAFHHCIF